MTAQARLRMMSMYSELLAASLRSTDPARDGAATTEVALLSELAACRRDLTRARPAEAAGGGADASADIARQVDYDLALIRLCRLRGIDCDPGRFTRPLVERRRLEEALAAAGVELPGSLAAS
jgi:hypothetical protein